MDKKVLCTQITEAQKFEGHVSQFESSIVKYSNKEESVYFKIDTVKKIYNDGKEEIYNRFVNVENKGEYSFDKDLNKWVVYDLDSIFNDEMTVTECIEPTEFEIIAIKEVLKTEI